MDLLDEPAGSVSPAAESGEQPEASSDDGGGAEPVDAGTVPAFLHEIARQMQAAVDRERGRIAADAVNSLDAHVQKVRMRASIEAEELKRLAEEDVGHINEWSAAEAERLRRETENRIDARREDLERHLRQHDALVEREISGASEAIEEYQAELDRFVSRLAGEREPTEIAQLASQLPEPPRVEEIASAARAEAIAQLSRSEAGDAAAPTGLDLVGVMDPSVISPASEPKAQEAAPAEEAALAEEAAPAEEASAGADRRGDSCGRSSRSRPATAHPRRPQQRRSGDPTCGGHRSRGARRRRRRPRRERSDQLGVEWWFLVGLLIIGVGCASPQTGRRPVPG